MTTKDFKYRPTPRKAKDEVAVEAAEQVTAVETRERPKRRKVYERVREAAIPQQIIDLFKKDNYDLKLVRWAINGEEDYRQLSRREQEGYEFVTQQELPQSYLNTLRLTSTQNRQGLVTTGDLCLMKIDSDLRNSRREVYQGVTDAQVNAVNANVLEKKGLRNLGSKSKVYLREPSFQE